MKVVVIVIAVIAGLAGLALTGLGAAYVILFAIPLVALFVNLVRRDRGSIRNAQLSLAVLGLGMFGVLSVLLAQAPQPRLMGLGVGLAALILVIIGVLSWSRIGNAVRRHVARTPLAVGALLSLVFALFVLGVVAEVLDPAGFLVPPSPTVTAASVVSQAHLPPPSTPEPQVQPTFTPEQNLPYDPPFERQLDLLEEHCTDTREELSDYTYTVNKNLADKGVKESLFTTATNVDSVVGSLAKLGAAKDSCRTFFLAYQYSKIGTP